MPKKPKVLVLRTAGTNCDQETAFAFESAGGQTELVHINQLVSGAVKLDQYHILALPGGFSYGDDIESGRIMANELRFKLGEDLRRFIQDGKLMIGICNGFQIMVKAGILPGALSENEDKKDDLTQKTTLVNNDSGKFEDRWIHLKTSGQSPWTKDLKDVVFLPVAHGEGKFIPQNETVLKQLIQNGQVAFRYCSPTGDDPSYPQNPNGSVDHIAGITDRTGRILGLMPHPERHFLFTQHPSWTRLSKKEKLGDGAKIFQNGVDYVKNNFLKSGQSPVSGAQKAGHRSLVTSDNGK